MNSIPHGLVVFGFGGHARSVADVALAAGVSDLIFVDEAAKADESLWGFPVRRAFDDQLADGWQTFAAGGDNRRREAQVVAIASRSLPLATLIAPTATICRGAEISPGSFVGHHAHIGPLTRIGKGCIINTSAIVDHECSVGDFTHVSVNTSVAGRCRVGSFVFLGTGSTVIDQIEIADSVTVGGGGVVVNSLQEPGVYVGTPVRRIGARTL